MVRKTMKMVTIVILFVSTILRERRKKMTSKHSFRKVLWLVSIMAIAITVSPVYALDRPFMCAALTTSPMGGQAPANSFGIMDSHIRAMKQQVWTLEAVLNQPGKSGVVQATLRDLQTAVAQLKWEITNFQTRNRNANLAQGIKVSNDLQFRVMGLERAIGRFAQAADTASARVGLSEISTALSGVIKTRMDVPDCCLLTCCAIR